jgi:hypothetical protein
VAFELAKYDSTRPLYIDPLIYSSYLGGSGSDGGSSIAVDHAGNAYVTGSTSSTDFPTMDPLQPTNHSTAQYPSNAFVTKINPAGSALVYSTYLGGSGDDFGNGIAVDRSGDAYLIGFTSSTDFPTKNPIQPSNAGAGNGTGNTAFVAKLNSTGSALVYSTYLGGSSGDDVGNGIAADSSGNAYVIGSTQSSDFPVTPGAFQTTCVVLNYHSCQTVFVSKINKTGSALVYSTYLGGSGGPRGNGEFGEGIAADSAGNAYVTGYTYSTDFPTKNPLQPNNKSANAFISKINPAGSALVYSTYLGGSEWDSGQAIAVDGNGNVYVTGAAGSYDFPTKNPLQPTLAGDVDAFAAKINSAGSALIYSTFLGGGRNINTGNPGESGGTAIAADSSGNTYVTGGTTSPTFPLWNPYQSWFAGIEDAFVTKINATGSAFDYSTYFGSQTWNYSSYGSGIAADSSGNAYVTGGTDSPTLPTMNAFQPTYAGDNDAFVAKINVKGLAKTKTSLTSSPNPSSDGQPVTFTAVVSSKLGPPYNYEMVTFEMGTAVLGQGTLLNGSASFTTSTLPVGTDSVKAVYVGDATHAGSNSNVVKQVVQ